MIILFIVGLLLGALTVIFALQNTVIITVTLFSYEFTASLSIILILAVLSGIIITVLLVIPESISNYFKFRKLKKEKMKLEEELKKQKELTTFAKNTTPTREDITHIENGAIENHTS